MWEPKRICCCDVRKATIAIASSTLIISLIDIIVLLAIPRAVNDEYHEGCREFDQMVMDEERCQKIAAKHKLAESIFDSAFSLTNALMVAVSIMVIHGVRKNKPCLLVPYMVVEILGILAVIMWSITRCVTLVSEDLLLFFLVLICSPLVVFFMAYVFLVVRSCYLEVKNYKLQSYAEFQDDDAIVTAMT